MTSASLKEELKKRGRAVGCKKDALLERLLDCLRNNAPVTNTIVEREENMNGLNMTARWELLPQNPIPIPELANQDATLCPPSERDAPITLKYGYVLVAFVLLGLFVFFSNLGT